MILAKFELSSFSLSININWEVFLWKKKKLLQKSKN